MCCAGVPAMGTLFNLGAGCQEGSPWILQAPDLYSSMQQLNQFCHSLPDYETCSLAIRHLMNEAKSYWCSLTSSICLLVHPWIALTLMMTCLSSGLWISGRVDILSTVFGCLVCLKGCALLSQMLHLVSGCPTQMRLVVKSPVTS